MSPLYRFVASSLVKLAAFIALEFVLVSLVVPALFNTHTDIGSAASYGVLIFALVLLVFFPACIMKGFAKYVATLNTTN